MTPLLSFVATIKGRQVIVVGALALLFAGLSFGESDATSGSNRILLSLHSALAVAVMIFALAFVMFAWTTEKFGAGALFPSIFAALMLFVAVAIVGYGLEDPGFDYLIVGILGTVTVLAMSGL